ncbi:uncharacterized protein LOC134774252 [Penaeus indicus]|uniref:uncharacterized protein LOC134774252 n=1 Tax=Penaeus indicus TaxID=29960 RepID=UPI00300DA997
MYRNSDANFLEQQNYLGHRNIPSQDILSMISGVPHDDQELDPYDSSPDFFNEFQRDQENSSLEELQESGHAYGNFEEAVGNVGVVGADAHTPNAPAVTVPSRNSFPLPRAENPPSRDLPENHELFRELSDMYRNSDANFLEQQNYLGHRNIPSQDILSMISGVPHDDQELDPYDSSPDFFNEFQRRVTHDDQELDPYDSPPDIFNEFQRRDQENSSLEELQESGHAYGNFEEAVGNVGVVGADAHTPNAPAVTVPSRNSFPLPRAGNPPSRDLPENHELFRELSDMYRNSDANFLEQQNYLGHRNIPSQDILSMISGVPHDDQELDPYDSSPEFFNEFQRVTHDDQELDPYDSPPDIFNEFQRRTLYPVHQNYEAVDDFPNPVFARARRDGLQDDEQYPRSTS